MSESWVTWYYWRQGKWYWLYSLLEVMKFKSTCWCSFLDSRNSELSHLWCQAKTRSHQDSVDQSKNRMAAKPSLCSITKGMVMGYWYKPHLRELSLWMDLGLTLIVTLLDYKEVMKERDHFSLWERMHLQSILRHRSLNPSLSLTTKPFSIDSYTKTLML